MAGGWPSCAVVNLAWMNLPDTNWTAFLQILPDVFFTMGTPNYRRAFRFWQDAGIMTQNFSPYRGTSVFYRKHLAFGMQTYNCQKMGVGLLRVFRVIVCGSASKFLWYVKGGGARYFVRETKASFFFFFPPSVSRALWKIFAQQSLLRCQFSFNMFGQVYCNCEALTSHGNCLLLMPWWFDFCPRTDSFWRNATLARDLMVAYQVELLLQCFCCELQWWSY